MTAPIATLERVESHLPDRRVAIETLAGPLGLSRAKMSLFRKVHGLHTLHHDPGASLFDLLLPAARQVVESLEQPHRIRFLIYVHAIHEVAPAGFDAAAVLRDALGPGHAEAFALSQQNCAGGLGAVEVATRLLADGAPADRALMRGAVREAGLALDDIDLVVPCNVNMLAWRNTIAELGVTADRVFLENIPRYSHCFAADPFVDCTTLRTAGRLVDGRRDLMAGVGAGATVTALALTHRGGAR
ncbi:3-oxoacyl-ACP synthase [Streptomyces sp. ZEA17I]|uniref:3-oxoacyl-[acyl-carrier-protein] synthase III C-terminal domain-containing protein n=1 Tax=Streptomyces sp. ZEA17I TaxID=2202516 RepID=UPI000D6FC1AC|nr:3-oxoacyl-[acyl-carrier-protein] synthase III C-terminal domain-containing protein [Streptomyces sp. ZEA17I]PWS39906.1 3-oxoacyl-ACP synthase [Streptomyces sp. ZEA17I]